MSNAHAGRVTLKEPLGIDDQGAASLRVDGEMLLLAVHHRGFRAALHADDVFAFSPLALGGFDILHARLELPVHHRR